MIRLSLIQVNSSYSLLPEVLFSPEPPAYPSDTKVHPMDSLHNKRKGLSLDAVCLFSSYWKETHLMMQNSYLFGSLQQFPDTLSDRKSHLRSYVEAASHNEFLTDFPVPRLQNQYHMLFSLQHPVLSVLFQHVH